MTRTPDEWRDILEEVAAAENIDPGQYTAEWCRQRQKLPAPRFVEIDGQMRSYVAGAKAVGGGADRNYSTITDSRWREMFDCVERAFGHVLDA